MADMNVSLELNPETVEKIARAASCVGQDVPSFLQNYLSQSFSSESISRRTLDEILAPFRAQIDQSGLPDTQLDVLFTQARDAAFADRRSKGQ